MQVRGTSSALQGGALDLAPRLFPQIMIRCSPNSSPWFAVYGKYRHEKNIALALNGKGYEAFLPTYVKAHGASKKVELPLFPGYIFCRLDTSNTLPVLSTPGVFSILGSGSGPAPISEVDIESIRLMIRSGLTPSPWPYVATGQALRLTSGPLRGVQGVVVDASNEKWLVVSVELLQRSVAVKVERATLSVTAT
jgi:transcription termination/antitermination protein NusG